MVKLMSNLKTPYTVLLDYYWFAGTKEPTGMDLDVCGDVLLLGEANFSFTLSLLQYCDAKYVTTSCYESKECAVEKYGEEKVKHNLSMLEDLKCKRVLFGIDATNLKECLPSGDKFERIIFMFPHVGGKSNLKKNRQLLDNFLRSSRDVLDLDSALKRPSVFIALARGQGGTVFEEDPSKRNLKDSWQVLQLAQKNGFILTECFELDQSKFSMYASTGFRSQAKSFETRAGLVHRFETSLPLPTPERNFFAVDFLKTSARLIGNDNSISAHPFHELKQQLGKRLAEQMGIVGLEFMNDKLEQNLVAEESDFRIKKESISSLFSSFTNLDPNDFERNRELFLRSSLKASLTNRSADTLQICAGLVVAETSAEANELTVGHPFYTVDELNNLQYDILISYYPEKGSLNNPCRTLENELVKFLSFYVSKRAEIVKETDGDLAVRSVLYVYQNESKRKLAETTVSELEFISVVNASLLLKIVFDLPDERLLYSDDERVFASSGQFKNAIRPYSLGNLTWTHDISFWYDPEAFIFREFVDCVRNICLGLVRSIQFLEVYKQRRHPDCEDYGHAVCLRLVYQSCDRAFSWEQSSRIQLELRETLQMYHGVFLR